MHFTIVSDHQVPIGSVEPAMLWLGVRLSNHLATIALKTHSTTFTCKQHHAYTYTFPVPYHIVTLHLTLQLFHANNSKKALYKETALNKICSLLLQHFLHAIVFSQWHLSW